MSEVHRSHPCRVARLEYQRLSACKHKFQGHLKTEGEEPTDICSECGATRAKIVLIQNHNKAADPSSN